MLISEIFDFQTHFHVSDWQFLWLVAALLILSAILFFTLGRLSKRSQIQELEQRQKNEARFFDDRLDQLHHSFSSLSQQALNNNNESFMALASQSFARLQDKAVFSLDKKEQQFSNIVKPLLDTINKTEQRLGQLEKDRISSQSRLDQHISSVVESQQSLQQETQNLVTALRRPEIRGRWGELTLKRLLELSGMSPHCDFSEQVTQTAASSTSSDNSNPNKQTSSKLRPDVIVHLPQNRLVVIDAKTPLDAYLSAIESKDQDRHAHLQRHAKQIRQHISQLSQKQYWAQFDNTPEFVVMFIPGDHFLDSALELDKDLLEYSIKQRVTLATPSSLISLLRTIELAWNNHTLSENTIAIREQSRGLYERIATLSDHLAKLGNYLDGSVDQFNRLVGSYQRNVLPAANKLAEFDSGSKRDVNAAQIENQTRQVETKTN